MSISLIKAVDDNNFNTVVDLIKSHANVNYIPTPIDRANGYVHSPLQLALKKRNYQITQYLLENGADTNLQNASYFGPFIHSIFAGYCTEDEDEEVMDNELIVLLLSHEANFFDFFEKYKLYFIREEYERRTYKKQTHSAIVLLGMFLSESLLRADLHSLKKMVKDTGTKLVAETVEQYLKLIPPKKAFSSLAITNIQKVLEQLSEDIIIPAEKIKLTSILRVYFSVQSASVEKSLENNGLTSSRELEKLVSEQGKTIDTLVKAVARLTQEVESLKKKDKRQPERLDSNSIGGVFPSSSKPTFY